MTDPTNAALARLEVLVGEWELRASFDAATTGRAAFEWVLDGQFLVERAVIGGAPESIAIMGVNAAGDGFTQHYFDSRGVVRVYAMTFADGVWTLLRERPDFSPLDFSQRFAAESSTDGRTLTGRWESREGAAGWKHDFDLTYTRPE